MKEYSSLSSIVDYLLEYNS